jgi:hypothetical protein
MDTDRPYSACKMCGGPLMYLGTLRSLDHFRCRNCGLDQSEVSERDDEPEELCFPIYHDECEPCEGDV